ncbi:putative lipase ATG15, partial [Clarias magur]
LPAQKDVGQFGKPPGLIRPQHSSPSLISYQSTAGPCPSAGYTDEIMLEWCSLCDSVWEIKLLDHSLHTTSTPLESEI